MPLPQKLRRNREDGFDRGRRCKQRQRVPLITCLLLCALLAYVLRHAGAVETDTGGYTATPRVTKDDEWSEFSPESDRGNTAAAGTAGFGVGHVDAKVTAEPSDRRSTDEVPAGGDYDAIASATRRKPATTTTTTTATTTSGGGDVRGNGGYEALTFRALSGAHPRGLAGASAAAAREHCPFARDDSTRAAAFWRLTLSEAMIALGPYDAEPWHAHGGSSAGDGYISTTRDIYDALDGLGTILTCCPGVLSPGASAGDASGDEAAGNASGGGNVGPVATAAEQLPSCGLDDGADGRNVGFEVTIMFSRTLRAARLPSVALQVLSDAAALSTTAGQRLTWESEVATVLLQMGRVGDAADRLEDSLGSNGTGDLRALQRLGAALVVQGSLEEGASVECVDVVFHNRTAVWNSYTCCM